MQFAASDVLRSAARVDALHATGLLESPHDPVFDRLTRLAARIAGTPTALLTLVDSDRQVVMSSHGLPPELAALGELPWSHSPCIAVVRSGAPLAINDARAHPRFARSAFVVEWGVVAYCGVPLATDGGHILGVLYVADGVPRAWEEETVLALHDLARLAGAGLGLRREVAEREEAEARMRLSERHFRALVENASDVSAILDPDGIARYISRPIEEYIGCTADEIVGTRVVERIHPEDLPHVEATLARLANDPSQPVQARFRYLHEDGSWRIFSSVATNLLDDPAVRGIVVNTQDVTERELLAAQLRQAQKMEAVGRLAGGVAHDFNNLIQVITVSNMFAREALPPDSPALADMAEVDAAAERAVRLTRQLLAFSRQQVLRSQVVELNEVTLQAERMLRRMMGEDVALMMDLDPSLSAVHADPGQVEQVLMNLVVNARDAMPDGGQLTIETRNVTLGAAEAARRPGLVPGAYVALMVRDTGMGMDDETQCRIFEPFFTTKETGKGTGLGLATVYGIIKQSGGYVYVDSAPGAGSTFTILLPPHAPPHPHTTTAASGAAVIPSPSSSPSSPSPIRAIVNPVKP